MEKHKTCSFFGHRKIEITEELKQKLKKIIEDLIVSHNVFTFLFGSRSDFNSLCYLIVTELKQKYSSVKRIFYTCKSETCILESKRQKLEEALNRTTNQKITLLGFEEEFEHKTKYTAGRLSYVERNQAIINDSYYCVFYYDKNYTPPTTKVTKRYITPKKIKSGTFLAYNYAKHKKKVIFNVF